MNDNILTIVMTLMLIILVGTLAVIQVNQTVAQGEKTREAIVQACGGGAKQ